MISIGDALLKLGVDRTGLDSGMKDAENSVKVSMKSIQQGLMAAGAAFTAVGVAGMKMVGDAKQMNAQLGQTALTLGVSTKEMRNLALATTDVTFPLKSVADTFDLLSRAGVTNTEEMQNAAKAFDGLADATGSSAEVVADMLLPAFKLFGEDIPQTTAELDKFTWMTKKTLVDLSDFGTLLTRMAPYMDDLDMSMDDAIATLAALGEQGIVGTAATLKLRTAITQAASGAVTLNEALGLTQEEIDGFKQQMSDATGITEKYAAVANTQFTILDKVKQKMSEFSLAVGSTLEPLEGMFAAMTALGPAMIGIGMMLPKLITLFKSLPMIFRAVQLAATSMWGAITLGVSLAIAAGIALWQNWDKVVDFLKGAWLNIKMFFLQGVQNILDSLSMFTRFIPGLNNLIDSARDKIAGMIDSVQIEKDTLVAERALRDVESALTETTEIIENHAESTEIDTEAIEANRIELEAQESQLQKQLEAYEKLADQVAKTRQQFEYERSEAGRLGVTIKDVTFALFDLGWTNEQITKTLEALGEEADNVNAFLEAVGLTALEVAGMLDKQTSSVKGLTEAYKEQRAAEILAGHKAGFTGDVSDFGHGIIEPGMSAYQKAYAMGLSEEEYERRYGSYQYGGPIIEDTLLMGLKSMRPYAVAHAGERVTTEGQTANIIIMLDGRVIGRAIGQPLVDEIRVKTGVRI